MEKLNFKDKDKDREHFLDELSQDAFKNLWGFSEIFGDFQRCLINHNFFQSNVEAATTSKILKAKKSDAEPKKWYHGNKWYQRKKGAKWYQKEKKPMKTKPEQ